MAITDKIQLILETQDKMSQDLKNVYDNVNKVSTASKSAGDTIKKAFELGATITTLKLVSDKAKNFANEVDNLADLTGMSAEASSKWVLQANHVGISSETIATAITILTKNIAANSDAFDKFNIKTKDANGNLLPLEKIIAQIRDKSQELGKGLPATNLQMQLFGRSGKDLSDFLSLSNKETEDLIKYGKELGLVLSDDVNNSLEEANRKWNDMQLALVTIGLQINKIALPALTELSKVLVIVAEGWDRIFSLDKYNKASNEISIFSGKMEALTKKQQEIMKEITESGGKVTQKQLEDLTKGRNEFDRLNNKFNKNQTDLLNKSEKKERETQSKIAGFYGETNKEKEKLLKEFETKYDQAIRSETKNSIEELNKQKSNYAIYIQDKDKLNRWYTIEYGKIKVEEAKTEIDLLKIRAGNDSQYFLDLLLKEQESTIAKTAEWKKYEEEVKKTQEEIDRKNKEVVENIISSHAHDLLEGIRKGNVDLELLWQNLLDDLGSRFTQWIADRIAEWAASQLFTGLSMNIGVTGGGGGGGGIGGALGGAAKGAAAGSFLGPVGSVVGGVLGGIAGLFGFQEGGIVTRPILGLVGEAGPEAIIPLEKMNSCLGSINVQFSTLMVDNLTVEKAAKIIDKEINKLRRSGRSNLFSKNAPQSKFARKL